jgi:electron transfer flavoprotein alpha subunit
VVAEERKGLLLEMTLELLGKGQELARDLQEELCAVLLGHRVESLAATLIEYGAQRVYLVENELLGKYAPEAFTYVLHKLIERYAPSIVLYGGTWNGRDLAARVMSRVKTGLACECTELTIRDEILLHGRPVYGGRLHATLVIPTARPQMATVQQGVMEMPDADASRTGTIERIDLEIDRDVIRTVVIDFIEGDPANMALEEAEIVIGAGRGVGDKRNWEKLEELADLLRSPVGGTRPVRDAGWISLDRQIGQTGKTVSPRLYIACGISGAVQHTAGMKDARYTIAINTDRNAPIYKMADIKIVGDVAEIVPAITKRLREVLNQGRPEAIH